MPSDQAIRDVVQQLVSNGQSPQESQGGMGSLMVSPAPSARPSFGLLPESSYDPFAAEKFANPAVKQIVGDLATLPRRAIEASAADMQNFGDHSQPLQSVGPALETAVNMVGGAGIVPAEANTLRSGIKAYHGSPHSFDKFDLSKIGTGEGAQAYGHGLYFAEREGVAKSYRDALTSPVPTVNGRVQASGPGKFNVVDDFGVQAGPFPTMAEAQASMTKQPGHMYEVGIDADPARFLDWDKPLKDQPAVLEAAERMGPSVARRVQREKYSSGKQLLDIVANEHLPLGQATDANISAAMREAGLPGIKYLDQGSRTAGDGSRNYVVFDDKLVDIVKKYAAAGIALPPAIAAQYEKMRNSQD